MFKPNKQTLTVAYSDNAGGSWLWRRGKLAATRREAGVREGGLAAIVLKQNKQTLTVASSDDAGGSLLWRRGKLAVTRREAGVRGGLAAMIINNK